MIKNIEKNKIYKFMFYKKRKILNNSTFLMSLFLYTEMGEKMTIYIDLVFFLNFFFDFVLLLTVNNTLKRNVSLKRIFLGSVIGSITILFLFLPISSFLLFIIKILLGFLMCIVSFGIKDRKYLLQNVSYLYMTSTVLGGFLYFLNLTFSESHYGLIFAYDTISVNYLFLVIFSPIMLYIYVKQRREANQYAKYYPVTIYFLNGQKITLNSFLDTGNTLTDPITKKKIVVVNKSKIPAPKAYYYVPFQTVKSHGLMKCIKIKAIEIKGMKSSNYLVGIGEEDFLEDGIDCLLNSYCLEDLL